MNITTGAVWEVAKIPLDFVAKTVGNLFHSSIGIYLAIALIVFIIWRIFIK